ncbi:hypothetical protein EW145_g3309 [Phellinidium pouzarii]|uniref:Glycoside hydrolase family 71 protein n=1 Tax=Phellinidium pouzarii TaxID=167371 RepID=A0A4V3XCX6_9AGAM|nr:hypothetical protein EW145_g3309 [Phellinidium pouzarii]
MSRLIKKMGQKPENILPERPAKLACPKLVVAHFMVGNTAPYTPSDWAEDISLANKHGIDGFALNVGRENWQLSQVAACFDAAESSGTDFKLFLSFDMSSFPSSALGDIQNLKLGKALVSTFAGENSLFGCSDIFSAWTLVKLSLEEVVPWNAGWSIHLTPLSPPHEIHCPKLQSDGEYLKHLVGKTYMTSVSPWFFTHYGEESWNKNWIYRGDDWLFVRRWEQLIAMRDQVDIVQVISWNDFGESHYIGPIKGAQPNSEAWVNGFDHTAWLQLCGYFARTFKVGPQTMHSSAVQMFLPVEEDRIYVWARPHPKDAIALDDVVGKPRGWELTDDIFWVVIFASGPASVFLWSSDEAGTTTTPAIGDNTTSTEQPISAGPSKLSCALIKGGGMHVRLVRAGKVVIDFHPPDFVFRAVPQTYNFNAFVAVWPPA